MDERKPKRASIVFYDTQIFMECPFCGQTLIKTDYQRIVKLLEVDTPRGKTCDKCGGVAVLNLNSEARGIVLAKLSKLESLKPVGSK
jgi:predicted DCC family thiol-disulfide oxidoreductase YuxK